jgi:hypothetical protein
MSTTIKLKNSVTTTAAPSSLVQGEVATNVTDKKLWVGNAASSPVQLLGAGATVSGTNIDYTGTLTGGTGVVNLGSGQFYKDASGNVGIGTSTIGGNSTNRVVIAQGSDSANIVVTKTGNESGALYAYAGSIYAGSNTNHPFAFVTNGT